MRLYLQNHLETFRYMIMTIYDLCCAISLALGASLRVRLRFHDPPATLLS